MRLGIWPGSLFALTLLVGCGSSPGGSPRIEEKAPDAPMVGHAHRPETTGSLTGQVTWRGPTPTLTTTPSPLLENGTVRWLSMKNPFAPVVDPKTSGLVDTVVFIREVMPELSRLWLVAPVTVVARDFDLQVRQGDVVSRVGFVHRSDEVEFVSDESVHTMIRGRGAAYFTLPLPDKGSSTHRRLTQTGRVELSNGAGQVWAGADLFVSDHPYFARTDANGMFKIDGIPAGSYELVCWKRSWHVKSRERDPETGLVFRQKFADPVEKTARIKITAKETTTVNFDFSQGDFPAP